MAKQGESPLDFFYNKELGWGTGATFFLTGIVLLFVVWYFRRRH